MTRYTIIALGLLAAASTGWAQGITTHKITDSIYMLEGSGGNVGLSVGEDGILVIDSQYPNMAEPILDAIKKIQKGKITFLVNTHFHGDHTGGNKALAQDTPVIGHMNVRARMARGKDLSDVEFRNSLPVITYDDAATIHFNGEDIQLYRSRRWWRRSSIHQKRGINHQHCAQGCYRYSRSRPPCRH